MIAPVSPLPRAVVLGGLLALLAGVAFLQVPHLDRPPFDAHSFRQAQTLATIELFARDGIDLAHARTNYVGEPGLFVLELPLFQALAALLYGWFGPHLWLVRILNLLFTLGNAGLIAVIGRRMLGAQAGALAAVLYLFAPLQQVFMGSTLIDPSAVTLSLLVFLAGHRLLLPGSSEGPAGAAWWAAFALSAVVTALIKPLYLFPTCVLMTAVFLRERRLTGRLWASGGCLAVAGVLFYFWLRHGRAINDASWFTRGVDPTILLSFQFLANPAFYVVVAKRILIHLAGPAGGLLLVASVGLMLMRGGQEPFRARRLSFGILLASLLGYYAVFPRVNFPHDYYSLIIAPYACLLASLGASLTGEFLGTNRPGAGPSRWLPPAFVMVAIVVSAAWFFIRQPLLPKPGLMEAQRLAAGRFDPLAFAIVMARPDPDLGIPPATDAPGLLHALRLRGTGRTLSQDASSSEMLALWNEQRPHYSTLRYVVFYRVTPPDEIRRQCKEPVVEDPAHRFHAFRVE